MNKSFLTNIIASLLFGLGFVLHNNLLLMTGLFALSGALTNWLAIYMLFEKVPGLYGSGVIPNRFEEIKRSLHELMMSQFFSQAQIDHFLANQKSPALQLSPIIDTIDLTPIFDKLVETIMQSSFGSMLGMFGGVEALTPLKAPFLTNLKTGLVEMSESDLFHQQVQQQIDSPAMMSNIQDSISQIVQQRLDELTPELVKTLMQQMIQRHLGWLVVWGGVFGGLIGVISSLLV